MDLQDKLTILQHECDLHGVFLSFCAHFAYPLHEAETVNRFCDFLLEIIDDGSVHMVDKSQTVAGGKHPPYSGTPEQFVAEFKAIYPTWAQCQAVYPEEPKLYLEMIWWTTAPRNIELSPHFHLTIYVA